MSQKRKIDITNNIENIEAIKEEVLKLKHRRIEI